MRAYLEWQTHHYGVDFIPAGEDDVDLRSYLFHLQNNGATRFALENQITALKVFYKWAKIKDFISHNPFDEYDFNQPFLTEQRSKPR